MKGEIIWWENTTLRRVELDGVEVHSITHAPSGLVWIRSVQTDRQEFHLTIPSRHLVSALFSTADGAFERGPDPVWRGSDSRTRQATGGSCA